MVSFKNCIYWCMCAEIGEEGTYHIHIFIYCTGGILFTTMQKKFPGAHLESCKGTAQENRDYIRKEGKWENDKKKETNLISTFYEVGDCPEESQGRRSDYHTVFDMIRDGCSNVEIYEKVPHMITKGAFLDRVRNELLEEQFKDIIRDVEVYYVYGVTGAGKTYGILDKYGISNVCRIDEYTNPFDKYEGQDVLLLDEYRGQLKISELLVLLEGYPMKLRARYADRQACFTKVFIASNEPLYELYPNVQVNNPETWKAFLRRINSIVYFSAREVHDVYDKEWYFSSLGFAEEQKKYLRNYSADYGWN